MLAVCNPLTKGALEEGKGPDAHELQPTLRSSAEAWRRTTSFQDCRKSYTLAMAWKLVHPCLVSLITTRGCARDEEGLQGEGKVFL